jgi:cytochrome c oxidase cbb3-type subunit II
MKNLPTIFLGVFLTLAASWTGLIYMGNLQLGGLEPTSAEVDPTTKAPIPGEQLHPVPLSGIAKQGKQVYIDQGCLYCHSQQVRRKSFGADYARGWGDRQSVPRDYIWQERVLLGTMRTGPDLKSVGTRLSDPQWHYLHLYNPQITSPGSIMPPFRYLFEVRPIKDGVPSADALRLPPAFAHEIPEGHELLPTPRARALVQYLMELRLDYDLPEMKRK